MKIITFAAWCFVVALIISVLVIGKTYLIPFFLAIAIWYLINATNQVCFESTAFGKKIPSWLGTTISSIIITGIMFTLGQLLVQNINYMIATLPKYQDHLIRQLQSMIQIFGVEELPDMQTIRSQLNFGDLIGNLLTVVQNTTKNFFVILIYVIFLLLEQGSFNKKIDALRLSPHHKERIKTILTQINTASRTYILVKTLASILTGLLCYFVLIAVDVEFALFWSFLIFLLNYIPTIGSILATAFPALMTLVQFDTLTPFFIVLLGLVGIQLLVGSYLEPRFMGYSLNISPLVVILSLMLWGFIWGAAGMILCVPITVIIIITLSHFPTTRPVAVLLSKDGNVGN